MIARVWRGYTKPDHADAYEALLEPELLPGLSTKPGFRGSYLLRRPSGGEIEFMTIILWDSLDAVRALTGPDYETAVVPEERRRHLTRYDAKAAHNDVVSWRPLPIASSSFVTRTRSLTTETSTQPAPTGLVHDVARVSRSGWAPASAAAETAHSASELEPQLFPQGPS